MIITALLWAALVAAALLAVSGYVRMARADGGWREAPLWTAPLIFTSAALALLTAASGGSLLSGAVLALIPLVPVVLRASQVWRKAANTKLKKGGATLLVASILRDRVRDALWNAGEDLRMLTGRGRDQDAPRSDASRAGFIESLAAAARHVPPLREDGRLGDAPAAAEVAASLEAAGAMVPPPWAALAEFIRDFDPDGDEDELLEFVAGCAAGVLTLAESLEDLAESLLNDVGLDPEYAMGFIDAGAEAADFSGAFALLDRRYHDVYEGIHEHVEAGGTLPNDARGWFSAHGGAPEAV